MLLFAMVFGVWLISRKDNGYLPPSNSGGLHFGSPLVPFIMVFDLIDIIDLISNRFGFLL